MMDYIQISISLTQYSSLDAEILIAWMANMGYDGFLENEKGFDAFIPTEQFEEDSLNKLRDNNTNITFKYKVTHVPYQNWNEEWEKNYFKPIIIGNKCVVRSPFHPHYNHIPYQIIIEPKMAFGTGHHETTSMVMEHLLEYNVKGKMVLDMGCGTGILGILASMLGAKKITAIDNDQFCVDNSNENCQLNEVKNMSNKLGDSTSLGSVQEYDIILANINRNILLEDIPAYATVLKKGGTIILSGFYNSDITEINKIAENNYLVVNSIKENNNWVAVSYEKIL